MNASVESRQIESICKGSAVHGIMEAYKEFNTAMRIFTNRLDPDGGVDEYTHSTVIALFSELRSLPQAEGKDIAARMLTKDSPLAAVAQAAETIFIESLNDDDDSSDERGHAATQVSNLCFFLLTKSGLLHGPVNTSDADDYNALLEVEVNQRLKLQAREAVLQASPPAT